MGLAVGDVVVETSAGRKTFNVGTTPIVLSPFAYPPGEGALKFFSGSFLASCPGSGKSPQAALIGSVGGQIARVDLALQPNDLKEVRVCESLSNWRCRNAANVQIVFLLARHSLAPSPPCAGWTTGGSAG